MTTPGAQRGYASRLLMGTHGLTPDQNLVAFLKPGVYQWTPPFGVNACRVQYISGGGGGGAGRYDAAGVVRLGGAGGGSAASGDMTIWARSSVVQGRSHQPWTLDVGSGGAGGISPHLANPSVAADGGSGGSGTTTTISLPQTTAGLLQLRSSSDAGGGTGGTATTSPGGTAGAGQIAGGAGSASSTIGGAGTNPTGQTVLGATGGGSGAGITAADAPEVGGVGGGYSTLNTGVNSDGPYSGLINGGAGQDGYAGPFLWGQGGGGGGSSANFAVAGGAGGVGILGSGGGGGGAGTLNASSAGSGPGGRGGDGAIVIWLMW